MVVKDIVGIGKAVRTVSDAVRGAISTLYRPTAIAKEGRARADVKAYEVEVLARAQVNAAIIKDAGEAELAERAKQRFIFEQVMQQQSLEQIFQKAIEFSKKEKNRKGRKISDHWLYRLLINSKDVTNEEIQDIFAKLIVEQGTAGKNSISYMTLDALRLFEPRHAKYFENFCQLFYLFGGVHYGMRDRSGEWIGDDEFSELRELGMVETDPIPNSARLRLRHFSLEIATQHAGDELKSIFGHTARLALRGIELSKVLYPDLANEYWHGLRKDNTTKEHERLISKFVPPETQYECFKALLDLVAGEEAGDETHFAVVVHPWGHPYGKHHVVLKFDGNWRVQSKAPASYYVPAYLRRLVAEYKGTS